jgi:hypothetical protein
MVRNLWVRYLSLIFSTNNSSDRWDEITLISLINHVLEEAKQKLKNPPEMRRHQRNEESYRDSESKITSHELETSGGLERDILDIVPVDLEKYAQTIACHCSPLPS